ncbi:MAG TPA: SRPBCC family protein [Glycomyces sp.]|nr:SRPBCC family protein [Glycomyces sp.]
MSIVRGRAVSIEIDAPAEAVFAVLADGWTYPAWVVGASHVRDVDERWPARGSRLHHSIGPWPLHIEDVTVVLTSRPPTLLELEARLWPLGAAWVRLELAQLGPHRTRVTMTEQARRGPIHLLPKAVQSRVLAPRNRESLRRLAHLTQGRSDHTAEP